SGHRERRGSGINARRPAITAQTGVAATVAPNLRGHYGRRNWREMRRRANRGVPSPESGLAVRAAGQVTAHPGRAGPAISIARRGAIARTSRHPLRRGRQRQSHVHQYTDHHAAAAAWSARTVTVANPPARPYPPALQI